MNNFDKSSKDIKEKIIKDYDEKNLKLYKCYICDKLVEKEHYFNKEYIDKFNNKISISFKTSLKNKFIDIICDFHMLHNIAFYEVLFFKHKIKKLILEKINKSKNYKISIYKYNHSINNISDNKINFWIEKYDIDNINDIDNIENLYMSNFNDLKPININKQKISTFRGINNNNDLENVNLLSSQQGSGNSIKIIQNTRCIFKISEINLFSTSGKDDVDDEMSEIDETDLLFSACGKDEIEKIPQMFFKLKSLLIIKNFNDQKCFVWNYIRKSKNCITSNAFRITKKDKIICKELELEYDIDFNNVSLKELDDIEDILEINIHVFGCNKTYKNKKIIRKSIKDYSENLDLLLIDGIAHYILIKKY